MIIAYRLCRSKYSPNDGSGAALIGGRWNAQGVPVIYASASASLAALEVLVHFSELPKNYTITRISIPSSVSIERAAVETLRRRGRSDPTIQTRRYGTLWAKSLRSAVLAVQSAVIPEEFNYLLNPVCDRITSHPEIEASSLDGTRSTAITTPLHQNGPAAGTAQWPVTAFGRYLDFLASLPGAGLMPAGATG